MKTKRVAFFSFLLLSAVTAFSQTLPEALDDLSLTFSTAGDAAWLGQTNITYDGVDAAESGAIENGESSSMSTTIQGPAEVSFYWSMQSSEGEGGGISELSFQVDGQTVEFIDYDTSWEPVTVLIHNPAVVELAWVFEHGVPYGWQDEIGWVDQLVITPTNNLPPHIYEQPDTDIGLMSNDSVMLEVSTYGDSVSYQWYEGESGDTSSPISGATGAAYTTPALTSNTTYWVQATNPYGTDDSQTANLLVYREVYTATDLQNIGSGNNGWEPDDGYILMSGIDCSSLPSNSVSVISNFYGILEGNGFIISNLYLDAGGQDYAGLIGVNSGVVSRIGIETFTITNTGSYAGGICAANFGTIRECFASDGQIPADGGQNIGLLCGQNYGPNHNPGPGVIEDCYSSGIIQSMGAYNIGGLIGHNGGVVRRCYSIAQVNDLGGGYGDVGGFTGNEGGNSDISSAYYNAWADLAGSAVPLYPSEFTNAASFVGFDFADTSSDGTNEVWDIATGHCPKLAWETGNGLTPPMGPVTTLSGEGSPTLPFVISSLPDFHEFSANTNLSEGYYLLNTNIDLSGTNYTTAAVNREFHGSFDGNGNTISNLMIDASVSSADYVGLFSNVHGSIQNLHLENISVTGTSSLVTGGLCAELSDGVVSNCSVSGSIEGSSNVGALCGFFSGGSLMRCSADADVTGSGSYAGGLCGYSSSSDIIECYATGSVAANNYAGGLIGYQYFGLTENCYATGDVTGNSDIGGFCGYKRYGTQSSCYSVGTASGTSLVGGFCGRRHSGTFLNCYFDETAGPDNGDEVPLTALELLDAASFIGFDFVGTAADGTEDLWDIASGEMPKLAWQAGAPAATMSFASWVVDQGIPGGEQGEEDDPAGDDIANLLKYTCGLVATQVVAGSELIMIDTSATNLFTIQYQRAKGITDATVYPVYAPTLEGPWVNDATITESFISEDTELEYWEASIPVTSNGFMRLRAE